MTRRTLTGPLLLTLASLLFACSGGSSSGVGAATAGVSSAAPATSATGPTLVTSSTTAGAAVPSALALPLATLFHDPGYVPSGPDAASWYGRLDDPATALNEAAHELATEMAGNGLDAKLLEEHFARGGALAIFVSGAGHERDTPTRRSGWMAPYALYVQGSLGIPAIQVDYQDWAAGNDARALASYPFSFRTGVSRTHALLEKARSAGVGEVRLYARSLLGTRRRPAPGPVRRVRDPALVRRQPRLRRSLRLRRPVPPRRPRDPRLPRQAGRVRSLLGPRLAR